MPSAGAATPSRNLSFDSALIGAALIFLAYAAVEIALFVTHVPWRDEGQAWLWAQTISSPATAFVLPGEGHPPLWYWLLKLLSFGFSFEQARISTLVLALINAGLILRLMRDDLLVAALVLFSHFVLHSWGYIFRPYALILTLTLCALLADRARRPLLATWLSAIACGLHVFAGLLLAFWLPIAWRRGLRLQHLTPPVALAAAFAALVALSGSGNSHLQLNWAHFPDEAIQIFAAPFAANMFPLYVTAPVAAALIAILLWRDRSVLIIFATLALAFSGFAAIVYGTYDWHIAFLVVLLLIAYTVAEPRPPRWPMIILLVPSCLLGGLKATHDVLLSDRADLAAYEALLSDAGPNIDPARNLLAWPDQSLLGLAARDEFQYVSGNNGVLVGPVLLTTRDDLAIDPAAFEVMPDPYWLYCIWCDTALEAVAETGRTAVELYTPNEALPEPVGAYRIEMDR